MNVVWEPVPYDAGIPVTEFLDLVRVYPECSGLSGDGGLEFVVSEGRERALYAWVKPPS